MKTSVIPYRVADFLKCHAPFDVVSQQDLLELAGSGRVKFHQTHEYLFRQGDPKGQLVWVIQQGRVEAVEQSASGEQLRDVMGEGDLLGLDRFAGDGAFLYSARTASDVILYGFAADLFESMAARYPSVKRFLAAHSSVAGIMGFGRTSWLDAAAPSMDFLRSRLVTLALDATVAEAARAVARSKNGVAAFADEANRPVAIIAAADLCARSSGVARLAARPLPPVMLPPLRTRELVREMLRERTGEIAVTADGRRDSPLEGILTASELALFCGQNPSQLIGAIHDAASPAEMAPLLRLAARLVLDALAQPADVDDCCQLGSEITAALANACVRLASAQVLQAGIDPPNAPCCWVMFGGAARGELMVPAHATIAAVYDDSSEDFTPEDSAYFAAVAGETEAWFHAFGLAGPGAFRLEGAQPCMPLSGWKHLYGETIRNPLDHDLYASREFFDVWALCGEVSILRTLQQHIAAKLCGNQVAIPLLANDTLAHLPPLTFFDGLVLHLDGTQQDSFDIGEVAIAPIAGAARVFAIAKGNLTSANTLARLETAGLDFPQGAAIFREAADAFRIALYYQALSAGPRINPAKLGRFDQLLLKGAFSSIHRLLEFTASTFLPCR